MNNFEPNIADWRRRLIAAGIKSVEVLDELEGHLREDIERRIRAGADVARVFELAAARFGEPCALKVEFDQVEKRERKYMKRGLMIGAGIIGVMVGMAFVTPAVAQYRQTGAMQGPSPWLFLLGSVMTIAGCIVGAKSFKKKQA